MVQVGFRVGRTENENTQERKEVRIMAKKTYKGYEDDLRLLRKLTKRNKRAKFRLDKIEKWFDKNLPKK